MIEWIYKMQILNGDTNYTVRVLENPQSDVALINVTLPLLEIPSFIASQMADVTVELTNEAKGQTIIIEINNATDKQYNKFYGIRYGDFSEATCGFRLFKVNFHPDSNLMVLVTYLAVELYNSL